MTYPKIMPVQRRSKSGDLSNPKKNPPLPQDYYSLEDAANLAKLRIPNFTPETIAHYATRGSLDLFTPAPIGKYVIPVDTWAEDNGAATAYDYCPNKPHMLVLSRPACSEIEMDGRTYQSDFVDGYLYIEGTLQLLPHKFASDKWVWRTIIAADSGKEASPQKPRSYMGRSISTPGPLDPLIENEGISKCAFDKCHPRIIELTKKNVLISSEHLNLLIQRIELLIKNNDANNNPQNLQEVINKDTINVGLSSEPERNSEARASTQPASSVPQKSESPEHIKNFRDQPSSQPHNNPVIGKIKNIQIEIRGGKTVSSSSYIPKLQRPPEAQEFEMVRNITERTKDLLASQFYKSLSQTAENNKCSEDKLLELGEMGHLLLITPVPYGIYPHPVDESISSWNREPKDVPKFLVLDKLVCKEIKSNKEYKQKDFKEGFDIFTHKSIPAYIDETKSACIWRTLSWQGSHESIVITRDRVYVKDTNLTQLIQQTVTESKSDRPETKPESNAATIESKEQQQSNEKKANHSEVPIESDGHPGAFYSMKKVIELTGFSRSTINAKTKEGDDQYDKDFPNKYKLSKSSNGKVGFDVTEVDAWVNAQKRQK